MAGQALALIHSPLVGPFTWGPVAGALQRQGLQVVVPPLHVEGDARMPYWERYAAAAARGLESAGPDQPVILAGHSGAGRLLPAIRQKARCRVAAYVFVDAGIPRDGASYLDLLALESAEFAGRFRQALASGGRFPTWDDEALSEVIPDADRRRRLLAELNPQPLAYFDEPIPVFPGWPDAPCAYLHFSPIYDVYAAQARRSGWAYRQLEAGHFHMLVDPEAVAGTLLEMAAGLPANRREGL
jgi:pimeloyl-ACP methyl ester carboxylesterase